MRRAARSRSPPPRRMPTGCAGWPARPPLTGSRYGRRPGSMNGARFVHDQLELAGFKVAIADAQKVKGLAPLACKTDRSTPGCWPSCPAATWSPRSGCPPPGCGPNENGHGSGCIWSATGPRSRTASTPPCWPSASLAQSATCSAPAAVNCLDDWRWLSRGSATSPRPWPHRRLGRACGWLRAGPAALGADHPYVPLLRTALGIAWVLGYTIAAELGDIARFSSPKKLCGYTGCARGCTSRAAATSAAHWPTTAPRSCVGR